MTKATKDLPPLDIHQKATVTFDFANLLPAGVTLSVGTVNIEVAFVLPNPLATGDPEDIIQTAPAVGNSPSMPSRTDQAVLVQIGDLIGGVSYILQCYVTASSGDVPSIFVHASGVLPS